MRLSRYVFHSKSFAATTGRLKYSAFLPKSGTASLSVFESEALLEDAIWAISRDYVEPLGNRVAVARGDISDAILEPNGLGLEVDEPPPLHRNIAGFPEPKEERQLLAKTLADAATLVVRPPE